MMTATLLSEVSLPGLSSASGIEIIGSTAYVIGDDSAALHLLDPATLQPTGQVWLFDAGPTGQGRVPKLEKPDLECLAALQWPDGRVGLLLLGSGSLANRARGWFVPTAPGAAPEALNLEPLYGLLRAHLPSGAVLNLEGAATSATELLLFQRTVGRADAALLFRLPLASALAWLGGHPGLPDLPVRTMLFQLPTIDGCPAGFSGATFVGDSLLVTASVENTTDAVLDGSVLGSFVGVVDLEAPSAAFARLAWPDGRPYLGKVEGLAVRQTLGANRWELLLVTDDDAGGSTALVAEVAVE